MKLIVAICFLTTTLCYSQKFVSEDEISAQKFGTEVLYKSVKTDEPLQGKYKVALGDGAFYEVTFEKGRMNGTYKSFSAQGNLKEERNYANGELDGKRTIFYEDKDNIKRISHFKKGKLNGKYQEFNQKSVLTRDENYTDGKLDGTSKRFDDDGKLRLLETYKNGVAHGKWWGKMRSNRGDYEFTKYFTDGNPSGKWTEVKENGTLKKEVEYKNKDSYTERLYFDNGKLRSEEKYENKKLNGVTKYFFDTGILKTEINYKDDEPVSKITYHSNGKKYEEENYKNRELNGKYAKYSSNGQKDEEGNYVNGFEDGVWKYYHSDKDNFVRMEVTYVKGNKEGSCISYHSNGKKATEGNYKNNLMDGTWKYYSQGGKLVKEDVYEQRNLIKSTKYE